MNPARPEAPVDDGGVLPFRRDEASSYGWLGRLVVVIGIEPPRAEHIANYHAAILELGARHPDGVGVVTIIKDASVPGKEARDAIVGMYRELGPVLRGALFVPEVTGFASAVVRSVLGGILLAAGQRDRVRVEPNLGAGMPWLATRLFGEKEAANRVSALIAEIERFSAAEIDARRKA